MTKNLIIGILALIILTLVLCFIKTNEADKTILEANQLVQEAQRQEQMAQEMAEVARESQAESERLRQELLECQSK